MDDDGHQRGTGNGDLQRRRILAYSGEFTRRGGYSPSYSKMGDHVGLATSTVCYHVALLEADGSLNGEPGQPRMITWPGHPSPTVERDSAEVPLIGRIAAGVPLDAEEAIKQTFSLPLQLVGRGPAGRPRPGWPSGSAWSYAITGTTAANTTPSARLR